MNVCLVNKAQSFIVLLSAIKTDLSLLLECLKFQMKCPDLQKQALLTIHSICEKRGNSEPLMTEIYRVFAPNHLIGTLIISYRPISQLDLLFGE